MKNYNKSTHERESENILWWWNLEYSSRSPESYQRLEFEQRLASKTWNPESMAWNPESKTVLDSFTYRGNIRKTRLKKGVSLFLTGLQPRPPGYQSRNSNTELQETRGSQGT